MAQTHTNAKAIKGSQVSWLSPGVGVDSGVFLGVDSGVVADTGADSVAGADSGVDSGAVSWRTVSILLLWAEVLTVSMLG